jgi:DNA uptake protein ComE-like DNA-binding protein
MYVAACAIAIGQIIGYALFFTAPTDYAGQPQGALANTGMTIVLLTCVAATATAVVFRNPRRRGELPGVEQALANRQLRGKYRDLAESDRHTARELAVGRPDIARGYNDGGLLDVNTLSALQLSQHGRIPHNEAERIVAARVRLGRLSSVEEAVVYTELPPSTADYLREYAVFL